MYFEVRPTGSADGKKERKKDKVFFFFFNQISWIVVCPC